MRHQVFLRAIVCCSVLQCVAVCCSQRQRQMTTSEGYHMWMGGVWVHMWCPSFLWAKIHETHGLLARLQHTEWGIPHVNAGCIHVVSLTPVSEDSWDTWSFSKTATYWMRDTTCKWGVYESFHIAMMNQVSRCCSVLQCVAVCCSVLQCVAVCCRFMNVAQQLDQWGTSSQGRRCRNVAPLLCHETATHCNTLHYTATHCNTLQHTATHCHTLQHTATHCNTLQHTATHCNTLHVWMPQQCCVMKAT